jgi:hypothetical protein
VQLYPTTRLYPFPCLPFPLSSAPAADGNKSVKGTPYWMAPEVITQTGHGRQADLWSVACTVLEMATGRPPWSSQYPSQVAAMFHIAQSKGPPEIPLHLSGDCKDFLYLCFNRDWKARPLASTLLRHPFLADVPVRSHSGGPSPNAAGLAQVGGWVGGCVYGGSLYSGWVGGCGYGRSLYSGWVGGRCSSVYRIAAWLARLAGWIC